MGTQNNQTNGVSRAGDVKDAHVAGQTIQGIALHGTLVRLNRHAATFEIYNPALILRTSEVIEDFKIVVRERTIYFGKAVVRSVINAGSATLCEVTLSVSAWRDVQFGSDANREGLSADFEEFVQGWQKNYKVSAEFKVAVADIQSFLMDLRAWVEQIELGIRSSPTPNHAALERAAIDELRDPIISALDTLFEKFETISVALDGESRPAYRSYVQRHLHPIVLCAPFAYRSFEKPLGYAGDYELVNMMVGDPLQGGSLFAKIFNVWLLHQGSAAAHRNRIRILKQRLVEEAATAKREGRIARILSLGCGPAWEVREFMEQSELSNSTQFTLLDFDEETLRHTSEALSQRQQRFGRTTAIHLVRRSVHQLLKNSVRSENLSGNGKFDFIYCAGLFDYLSDRTCKQLVGLFYDWLNPNGLVLVTNVTPSSPNQGSLELILDWHLNYRDTPRFKLLCPDAIPADTIRVQSDETGVNLFLEARKPNGT
ncbi:MAG TPA: class I SAM-dependent methyltransferase [Verrucomicrobiae bacterium]|jgi:extracellular factor (EF) 3-hydroxypalmitic acid methyl ester biosynthesis protein|nr:class I SAM-dependent methyltransferase [Verrucomicrobiae bacterium]